MKVRLKQAVKIIINFLVGSFNSMKVRLKHEFAFNSQKYALLFQFHEGPIKT